MGANAKPSLLDELLDILETKTLLLSHLYSQLATGYIPSYSSYCFRLN